MNLLHTSYRRLHAAGCLFLALVIPVIGNRTAIAYLNDLSQEDAVQWAGTERLEPRDSKPKPTRQQLRVRVDKGAPARTVRRRPFGREAQLLPCATAVTPPVRGQRTFGMAKDAAAAPCYLKQYESPQSGLAPPG